MATTARLDLSVWRNDDSYEFPIRVRGPNLTGVALRAQVRLQPDTPGAPLIDLATVDNGNAQGLRLASVTQADGVWINDVRLRLNKSTRQALPYAGEMGDPLTLAWAMQIGGRTRIVGQVSVLAHAIDSDAAPAMRSSADYGGAAPRMPEQGATLTIAGDDVAEVVIDGADLLGAEAERAEQAATDAAESAATAAQGVADAQAVTAAFSSQAGDFVRTTASIGATGRSARAAIGVTDRRGRLGAGFMPNGAIFAQSIEGPSSPSGFYTIVKDRRGRPALAVGPDGEIHDRHGPLRSEVIAPRCINRPEGIKTWRDKRIARITGAAALVRVSLIGDSQFSRKPWTSRPFAQMMQRPVAAGGLGDGGPGWISFSSEYPGGPIDGATPTTLAGSWAVVDGVDGSPDRRAAQSSAAGDRIAVDLPAGITRIGLHSVGAAAVRYRYGAAAWTDLALGAGGQRNALTPPGGAATLTIEVVSGTVRLTGLDATAAAGFVFDNLAQGGSQAAQWAAMDQGALAAAVTRVGVPDVLVLSLGGNDELVGRSVAQFTADMRTLVATARAINAAVDIVVLIRAQGIRDSSIPLRMDAYAAAMKVLGDELDFVTLDIRQIFGSGPAEYGPNGTRRKLIIADGTHVDDEGGRILISALIDLLGV